MSLGLRWCVAGVLVAVVGCRCDERAEGADDAWTGDVDVWAESEDAARDGTDGAVDGEGGAGDATFLFDVCPGPWAFEDQGGCEHPAVGMSCDGGWCRIPAGCFVLGSPDEEPIRAAYSEEPTPVTLTRSFEIGQFEVTQAEWTAAGFPNPSRFGPAGSGECADADCPVENVTWYESLAYANRLSEMHDPPLTPCYVLDGCSGAIGEGMACSEEVTFSGRTVYDCVGYRLPTVAEWEYAARAGTRSTYYSGPICMRSNPRECAGDDPCLEIAAWYCRNGENRTHVVGGKEPNAWGLYDVLGNVSEWVNDRYDGLGYGGVPVTDPTGPELGDGWGRNTRGGGFRAATFGCRCAMSIPVSAHLGADMLGLRLVRTLP